MPRSSDRADRHAIKSVVEFGGAPVEFFSIDRRDVSIGTVRTVKHGANSQI